MKLAFICTESLPSPAIKGGAIQMMIDGVTPFLKKKFQLTIYSVTDPELPKYEMKDGVEYIRYPLDQYVEKIAENLKKQQFDIIHVFNRPKNVPIYKKSSPTSKIILGLHNDMFSEVKISTQLGKEVVETVNQIVTISNYIKETIVSRFGEANQKTKVVYSGVNLDDYPPLWSDKGKEIRNIYQNRFNVEDKKIIFFSGRLTKNKGAHLLIKAMKKIVRKYPDTFLIITGGKWFSDDVPNRYIEYLYRLAKPIENKVLFTKFIPAHEIPNLFLMSDIFVCSSQWQEPLARVHYEAMAAGLPVITTNRGGNAEVISHLFNGYLVKEFNKVNSYVKAIDYFLENQEFSSWIARNGRAFVEANFQFHHVADRLETVYLTCLEEKNNSNNLNKV
ncbi:glycosyl transferase [Anaerobacillus alkalidiazotrophicus]|uniref:Glycosyl transferase n=1 Tax=Anaerobacillus alkalidiazotrophicus TaxID=472963 RepID=A0A1S2M1Z5_9BACI|nr:glycosyltransferase family 4 protein [Anaerobacillus alkalidiazotrophicus]OIJ18761.1 glycosyl transferase [Anaerobacillus alkalidiazotrophicus]